MKKDGKLLAIIGGAYLYGCELSGPYIDRKTPHVIRKYFAWLLGLGRVWDDRLLGWLSVRDLDIKGEGTVVRMLSKAQAPGSLLHLAIRQIYSNWMGDARQRQTTSVVRTSAPDAKARMATL